MEGAQLVIDHGTIIVTSVQLQFGQAEHEVGRATMATHALSPAGIMPDLPAATAGLRRRALGLDQQFSILSSRWNQRRIGLRLIPSIRVPNPLSVLTGEEPRFDSLAR